MIHTFIYLTWSLQHIHRRRNVTCHNHTLLHTRLCKRAPRHKENPCHSCCRNNDYFGQLFVVMDSSTTETKLPKMLQTDGNSLKLVIKSWCFFFFLGGGCRILFDMNNNKALQLRHAYVLNGLCLNTASSRSVPKPSVLSTKTAF